MSGNRFAVLFIVLGFVTVTILALTVCAQGSWGSDISVSTEEISGAKSVSSDSIGVSDISGSTSPEVVGPPFQTYVTDIGLSPLKAPSPAVFEAGSAFTMEGWFFLTSNNPFSWLVGKGIPQPGGSVAINYGLRLDGNGSKVVFAASSFGITAPAVLPLRTWTHVAAVLDNGVARLYINGVQVATNTNVSAVSSAPTIPFGVGTNFDNNGVASPSHVAGQYARQVRFWNVARTEAQIAIAMSESLPSSATGLVADWPLDEAGGSNARDISGNSLALGTGDRAAARTRVLDNGPFFTMDFDPVLTGGSLEPYDSAVIDFDGDGDLDLVLAQLAPPTYPATFRRLLAFRNNNGTFVDATDAVLGTVMMINPRHLWVADFNRDGRPDLLIAETGTDTFPAPGEQSKLLIGSADGRLIDETASRLPAHISYSHGLAVADIDGDGDLDYYVVTCCMFNGGNGPWVEINNGSGVFTDGLGWLPADVNYATRPGFAACLVDVNGDGHPDLVLGAKSGANLNLPNEILINDGTGHFVHNSAFTLPPKLGGNLGEFGTIVSSDLNGDGAPDLLIGGGSGSTPTLQLLLNDGAGHFRDATAQLNLNFPSTDVGVYRIHVLDVNNDGLPDIVLRMSTNYNAPINLSRSILLNRGGAVFVDASEVTWANTGGGLGVGDFDLNGLPDLAITTGANNNNGIRVFRGVKRLDVAWFDDAASLDGRVVTPDARGLRNATVTLTNSQGVVRSATTSSFGFFSFQDVAVGDTYTIRISSRLYRFAPRTVQVISSVTLPDFVGLE